ncbi:hypothetical protein K378_00028 [Streptomyces sp. Amel2xB2]|uniref:hypothetical protein n=1 Tax=Streptomyces sp. Amel2xB2 TaxID=1305829 RepID=UPI000DB935DD|nr:hypothetical protein [Streptomyces sp. Amel2xB2]RAJ71212.1 hypothetical protein K378_00028 [Streptomyces sp. Amel2xB2]
MACRPAVDRLAVGSLEDKLDRLGTARRGSGGLDSAPAVLTAVRTAVADGALGYALLIAENTF